MRVPEKILIIRFSSAGDIILTSPLLRVLREKFPEARIDFLVKAEYGELLKFNPHLTGVIQLTSDSRDELAKLRATIRSTKYDAILDLHNSIRSRWVRMFSGAGVVAAVDKQVFRRFLLVKGKRNYYSNDIPVAERYVRTAGKLGVQHDGGGLEIFVPPDRTAIARSKLAPLNLPRYANVVGLVPGARHFTKRWPQDRYVQLGLLEARKPGTKILLFGGKEEADYCSDVAHLINSGHGTETAVSFAGKLTLLECAVAMDACSVVVTNDTGLMHLAAARKRNVVAIFGSTVKEFGFFPYGTVAKVVETSGLACRPCSHIGLPACPEKHFRCMNDISPGDVSAAVERLAAIH